MKHVLPDGISAWYDNGLLHREDGPAIEHPNGEQYWYNNGFLHREDGPAIITAAGEHWFINGVRHREDGPAISSAVIGDAWYVNGLSVERFCIKYDIPYTYKDWSLEHKVLWELTKDVGTEF